MSRQEFDNIIKTINDDISKSINNNLNNYYTKIEFDLSLVNTFKDLLLKLPEHISLKMKYDDLLFHYNNIKNKYEESIQQNISLTINECNQSFKSQESQIIIYTDGACKGNPGDGGWGVIILFDNKETKLYGGQENTTNNQMELLATIKALQYFKEPKNIQINTDSKYVKNGITYWIISWNSSLEI